jgi:electron transfer flavoprotein alpha subunit
MSETAPRFNPRRIVGTGPSGLPRVEISKPVANLEMSAVQKPIRASGPFKRWHMVIAYSDRGCIDNHTRQAVAAAAILASADTGIIAVVLGNLSDDLAIAGADQIAVLPDLSLERFEPERALAATLTLIKNYLPEHIFIPDNPRAEADLGRRLNALLGMTSATGVVELTATHAAVRYGAGLARTPLPQLMLLDSGVADTDVPFVGLGKVLDASVMPAAPTVEAACHDLGLRTTEAADIALEDADFVVSAGHGVGNVGTFRQLATTLGAVVGASRVAVDDGKFPRDRQIGASGKTISANAYIAVGISGAVQHLQGIKDCRHVIAINSDAAAPIVKRANLTIVGDAEEIMQALIKRVGEARAQAAPTESEP